MPEGAGPESAGPPLPLPRGLDALLERGHQLGDGWRLAGGLGLFPAGSRRQVRGVTHLVAEEQSLHGEHLVHRPDRDEVRLGAKHETADANPARLAHGPVEEHVRPGGLGRLRHRDVGLVELDRVDVLQRHEVLDVDRVAPLRADPLDLLVRDQDHVALLRLGRRDQAHGNGHQPEAQGPGPHRGRHRGHSTAGLACFDTRRWRCGWRTATGSSSRAPKARLLGWPWRSWWPWPSLWEPSGWWTSRQGTSTARSITGR